MQGHVLRTAPTKEDKMSEAIELQGCEHCSKEFPIETMQHMEGNWFCEVCTNEFQEAFKICEHKWSPHTNEMGDPGQYCENCSGFVSDDDFPRLFPSLHSSREQP
jgi:hypothetical protein